MPRPAPKVRVTIEGLPRTGKTTLAALLKQFLEDRGHTVQIEGVDHGNDAHLARMDVRETPGAIAAMHVIIRTEVWK